MSTVHTVKTVLNLELGDRVQAFKAKVKKVFNTRSGRGNRGGEWTKQGVICHDGSYEVELNFWNRADEIPKSHEGRIIYIEADGGCEVGEYKGKRQLSVPDDAVMTLAQPGEQSAPESVQAPRQAASEQAPQRRAGEMSFMDARAYIGRARNLMILCVKAAASANKELAEIPTNESQISALLFQAGERAGLIDAMPTGVMGQAVAPKPAPHAPQPEPNTPIESGETDPGDVPF